MEFASGGIGIGRTRIARADAARRLLMVGLLAWVAGLVVGVGGGFIGHWVLLYVEEGKTAFVNRHSAFAKGEDVPLCLCQGAVCLDVFVFNVPMRHEATVNVARRSFHAQLP